MSEIPHGKPYAGLQPASTEPSSGAVTPITDTGVFTRIKRTLSSRNYFTQRSSPKVSQPSTPSAVDQSGTTTAAGTPSIDSEPGASSPATHPTAYERFVSLSRRKKDGEVPFPPPHWFEEVEGSSEMDQTDTAPETIEARLPSVPEESPILEPAADIQQEAGVAEGSLPEPSTVAQKIRAMISSTPVPGSSSDSNASPSTTNPNLPLNMIHDQKLISLLSSPSVMNGSIERGRESVWKLLDSMNINFHSTKPKAVDERDIGRDEKEVPERNAEDDESDQSSIMLYAPLVPDADSKVEVAPSKVSHEASSETSQTATSEGVKSQENGKRKSRLSTLWSFTATGDSEKGKGKSTEKVWVEERLHVNKVSDNRVWVPSKDKISLEVNWWGYRIYLPPPVLAVLDNKQVEGAKRAAMLTTALKWLLDRVPTLMVPPQMKASMRLAKMLVPYLAYVGVFVAWSWGAIKSFDKGNGVVLTATWLLSVALVPGTWEDTDFPEVPAGVSPPNPATSPHSPSPAEATKAEDSTSSSSKSS